MARRGNVMWRWEGARLLSVAERYGAALFCSVSAWKLSFPLVPRTGVRTWRGEAGVYGASGLLRDAVDRTEHWEPDL